MDEGSHGTASEKDLYYTPSPRFSGGIFSTLFSQDNLTQVTHVADGVKTYIKARTSLLKSQRCVCAVI